MNTPGNFLVPLLLLVAPIGALVVASRYRAQVAVPIILMWSAMFLPSNAAIDPPVLPPIDKQMVPGAAALLGVLLFRRNALKRSRPFRGYDLLVVLLLIGTVGTIINNGEPISISRVRLPALTTQDLISELMKNFLTWWPAFFLGRNLYKTSADFRWLMTAIAVAGLVYAPLCLAEIRLSPQLNNWIYGYYQHDFIQTIRGSGFRPMVFMSNGLKVAIFMVMTVLAAAGLARARLRVKRLNARIVTAFLLITLVLCKSAGALLFAVLGLLLLWVTSPRTQARIAVALAFLAALYPLLRTTDVLPVEGIIGFFTSLMGEERASSLAFRLRNEALLLDHALIKPWFGWGGYGRNLVYDKAIDGLSGVPDGFWIGTIGARGLIGYVACYGLVIFPLLRTGRIWKRITDKKDRVLVGCLILMLVFFAVDQIPNATVDPYLIFLCGVLSNLHRGLETPEEAEEPVYEHLPTQGWTTMPDGPTGPTEPGPPTQPL